jgi:hypothetical protein
MSDMVKEAAIFAHAAHAAIKQKRKYTGEDYIVHPHNVAEMVARTPGVTHEMIAAAWLHDVREDCGIELGMIEYFFGPVVAQYVDECSHVDRVNDPRKLNRFERMAIELSRCADISPQAKTIKLADLLDNTESIVQRDPKFAVTYMSEKRRLVYVLIGGDPVLWEAARIRVQTYYALQGKDAYPCANLPQHVEPQAAVTPPVEPEAPAVDPATVWHPATEAPTQDAIYERRSERDEHFFSRYLAGIWRWTCGTVAEAKERGGAQRSFTQTGPRGMEWRGPVAPLPAE